MKFTLNGCIKKNPLGNFIGIDAVDLKSGEEIGQVGGIPYEFNFNGNKIKNFTIYKCMC